MRFGLVVVLLVGFFACDHSTAPDSTFVGPYGLVSMDGDNLLVREMADGSTLYSAGYMRTESSGAYSYTVLTQTCYVNGCTAPDAYTSDGTWSADGASITLKDSDGSSESWHFDNHRMAGTSTHLFKPQTELVFRRCDDGKPGGCLNNFLD